MTKDKYVTARISEETEAELERLASELDRTKSYIARKAIEREIKRLKTQGKRDGGINE